MSKVENNIYGPGNDNYGRDKGSKNPVVELHGWQVELDDTLYDYEIFTGITSLNTEDGRLVLIGVAEKWDTVSQPSAKRYVNIKFTKL